MAIAMPAQPRNEIDVSIAPLGLQGILGLPEKPVGVVIFAHGSGSGRFSARNRYVAHGLQQAKCATLLFDLLLPDEDAAADRAFDIPLLASRLKEAVKWVHARSECAGLPIGLFGASTGAGAALLTAAAMPGDIAAVVSRGGRPDLAGPALSKVRAPALLIVGGHDTAVIQLNRLALRQLTGEKLLEIIPSASHLFEESGTLEQVLALATRWFLKHFQQA